MSVPEPFSVDVLCVGHACWDINLPVDHHPDEDEKIFATAMTSGGGGPAANAAVAVRRLGGSSAFSGYLGHDSSGEAHMAEFAKEKVHTGLVVRGEASTPLSVVLIKPNGDRSLICYNRELPRISPEDIDFSLCKPRVLLFDGHQPHISLELLKRAEKESIPTLLDAGSLHEGTEALYDKVDYLVASEKFARQITGNASPDEAIRKLQNKAPVVIITCGAHGLNWCCDGERDTMPSFQIDACDTTGAGDTFHGAFALSVAHKEELHRSMRFASAAAALSCTRIGARSAIPTAQEVAAFLASDNQPR